MNIGPFVNSMHYGNFVQVILAGHDYVVLKTSTSGPGRRDRMSESWYSTMS